MLRIVDVDPEDYFLNWTLEKSAVVTSDSDEEDDERAVPSETRKHIVYQSALLELFDQVILFKGCQTCGKRVLNKDSHCVPQLFVNLFYPMADNLAEVIT